MCNWIKYETYHEALKSLDVETMAKWILAQYGVAFWAMSHGSDNSTSLEEIIDWLQSKPTEHANPAPFTPCAVSESPNCLLSAEKKA